MVGSHPLWLDTDFGQLFTGWWARCAISHSCALMLTPYTFLRLLVDRNPLQVPDITAFEMESALTSASKQKIWEKVFANRRFLGATKVENVQGAAGMNRAFELLQVACRGSEQSSLSKSEIVALRMPLLFGAQEGSGGGGTVQDIVFPLLFAFFALYTLHMCIHRYRWLLVSKQASDLSGIFFNLWPWGHFKILQIIKGKTKMFLYFVGLLHDCHVSTFLEKRSFSTQATHSADTAKWGGSNASFQSGKNSPSLQQRPILLNILAWRWFLARRA